MAVKYTEVLMKHFKDPHNNGVIETADVEVTEGSPACGDQITLYMDIDENSKEITDIKFQSFGCASNIATASIITDMAKGKTLEDAKNITWKEAADELGGLPSIKAHCSVLAVDTLKKAIKKYEIEKGWREPDKFSKKLVEEELRSVIHPQHGEDIVLLHMVRKIKIKDGIVDILIDIKSDDPSKNNIFSEIEEHMEKFSEIKELNIYTTDEE